MSYKIKAIYVYGQPMLVEFNGRIFQRKLEDNQIILGESVEKDGMATKIIEAELSEEELAQLTEGMFDKIVGFSKIAGTAAAEVGKSVYDKAVKVGGKAAAVVDQAAGKAKDWTKQAWEDAPKVMDAVKQSKATQQNALQAISALEQAIGSLNNFMTVLNDLSSKSTGTAKKLADRQLAELKAFLAANSSKVKNLATGLNTGWAAVANQARKLKPIASPTP